MSQGTGFLSADIRRILLCLLLLAGLAGGVYSISIDGTPFFNVYDFDHFPGGDEENWCAVQDLQGVMYFGNRLGLLEYDGSQWRFLASPNNSIVRSLAVDRHGIVFWGAFSDFGYLTGSKSGKLSYVSLKDKIPAAYDKFAEVWHIFCTDQGVYFVTAKRIFFYDYHQIRCIPIESGKHCFLIHGEMHLFNYNRGIFVWRDDTFTLLPGSEWLTKEDCGEILLLAHGQENVLILTEKKGAFLYRREYLLRADKKLLNKQGQYLSVKDLFEPFPTEIDDFCLKYSLYKAIRTSQQLYFIAPDKGGGILVMDEQGRLRHVFNRKSGFPTNIYLGFYEDNQGDIWALSYNGIVHLFSSISLTQFSAGHGIEENALSMICHQGKYYVGTGAGILVLSPFKRSINQDCYRFSPVQNANGTCWSFLSLQGHLLAATDYGLVEIAEDRAEPVQTLSADPTLFLFHSQHFPNSVFIATANGFLAADFSLKNQKLVFSEPFYFKSIEERIRVITEMEPGDVWLTSELNGILQIHFPAASYREYQLVRYGLEQGLPGLYYNVVNSIGNRLLIGTEKGIYQPVWEQKKQNGVLFRQVKEFVPDTSYGKIFADGSMSVERIKQAPNGNIWLWTPLSIYNVFQQSNGSFDHCFYPLNIIRTESKNFHVESDDILWIYGAKGLYRYDSAVKKDFRKNYHTLIRKIVINDQLEFYSGSYFQHGLSDKGVTDEADLLLPQGVALSFPFRENSFQFEFSAPFYEFPEDVQFSYQLAGFDPAWRSWSPETKAIYTNLSDRDYTFEVKARNVFDLEGAKAVFCFSIRPPWQRTIWAYLAYGIVFFLFLYGGIRLNNRRLLEANYRLEQIVNQRTKEIVKQKSELEAAYGDLSAMNSQLVNARNALWSEMELAKKIQTVLLPEQPHIPGYEIAAYMNPANEVGGDYYDVIEVREEKKLEDRRWKLDSERAEEKDGEPCRGGSCARPQDSGQPQGRAYAIRPYNSPTPDSSLSTSYWLSIGDVSGHGVSAGLVMMMVQTAIRTALGKHGQQSPEKILSQINQAIHYNINKMGEDKYMTITLMKIEEAGKIYYSGLHQDILIFRAASGRVEQIETKGMWLGIVAELDGMNQIEQLTLDAGDVMLLYSDGITEAVDTAGAMYSSEKLAALLKETGKKQPEEIKQRLVESLQGFSGDDDITFVIVRRH